MDRRSQPRFPANWPLRAGHRTLGNVSGRVVDISGTGFLFTVPEPFEVGDLIEMEITVNPLFVIRCAASIVRGSRLDDGAWAFAAAFHGLSDSDMAHLTQSLVLLSEGTRDDALSFRPARPLGSL